MTPIIFLPYQLVRFFVVKFFVTSSIFHSLNDNLVQLPLIYKCFWENAKKLTNLCGKECDW